MTTREALNTMLAAVHDKAQVMLHYGYSDSDYDTMENLLDVTQGVLAADFEDDESLLPRAEEAPWCPDEVIAFLRERGPK